MSLISPQHLSTLLYPSELPPHFPLSCLQTLRVYNILRMNFESYPIIERCQMRIPQECFFLGGRGGRNCNSKYPNMDIMIYMFIIYLERRLTTLFILGVGLAMLCTCGLGCGWLKTEKKWINLKVNSKV